MYTPQKAVYLAVATTEQGGTEGPLSVPAQVKRIRGKLNVPRERFWLKATGLYRQARPPARLRSKEVHHAQDQE